MWGRRSIRRWGNARTTRRGAAVVETAVVTPLILTMLFGVIEFGWVFMIQQSLTNSVREACRVGTLPGATDTDITDRFVESMEGTGMAVTPDMVTIEHATEENPIVTVRASMAYADVSLLGGTFPFWPFGEEGVAEGEGEEPTSEKMIGSVCSMRKEGL